MVTSDHDISTALQDTLHHQDIAADQAEIDAAGAEAQCFPFLCKKDKHFDIVQALVRNFSHFIQGQLVKPGDLLLISGCGLHDEAYFLGTVLKKPLLQTLVQATVGNEEAGCMLTNGCPVVFIAHQIFLQGLRSGVQDGDAEFEIQAWKCQPWLESGRLKVNPVDLFASTTLTTTRQAGQPKAKSKPATFLHAICPKKSKARPPKVKATTRTPKGPASQKAVEHATLAQGASNSSTSSESELEGECPDGAETEEVLPASRTISRQQRTMPSVAEEVEISDSIREMKAESIRTNQLQPRTSFFNKERGLHEGAIAVSSRAICLGCKKVIEKGTVRFSWFHSCVRPNGWIHAHCTMQYIRSAQHELRETSIKNLKEILTRASSSASGSRKTPNDAEIQSWARNILETLQKGL